MDEIASFLAMTNYAEYIFFKTIVFRNKGSTPA